MKTSEILFRAREIQLERGRARYERENSTGAVCMMGALSLALSDGESSGMSVPDRYRKAITRALDVGDLWSFSDFNCATKYDMAAAFEIAACCASAEGK